MYPCLKTPTTTTTTEPTETNLGNSLSKKSDAGAGEMAQPVRAMTELAEDPSSVPSPPREAHNHL